jgi:hypothetical protein
VAASVGEKLRAKKAPSPAIDAHAVENTIGCMIYALKRL